MKETDKLLALRRVTVERGASLAGLATALGLTLSQLQRKMHERSVIGSHDLELGCAYLGISATQLHIDAGCLQGRSYTRAMAITAEEVDRSAATLLETLRWLDTQLTNSGLRRPGTGLLFLPTLSP